MQQAASTSHLSTGGSSRTTAAAAATALQLEAAAAAVQKRQQDANLQDEFKSVRLGTADFPGNEFTGTALIWQHTKAGQGREALHVFRKMQEGGVKLGSHTFVAALKACSTVQDLETARQIHSQVTRSGCLSVAHVGNTLVDVYAKCGSLVDARCVFEEMPQRNVIAWTAIIMGYAQSGEGDTALQLYARMQQEGVAPNDRTLVAALKACSSLVEGGASTGHQTGVVQRCLEQVRAIHSGIAGSESEVNMYVGTMLVDVYAKCGCLHDAKSVFERMPHRNVASWNAMILGCAQMEQPQDGLALYAQIRREGVRPDDRTFVAALKACSVLAAAEGEACQSMKSCLKTGPLAQARWIHSDAVKAGSDSALFVANILLDVYAKCGSLEDAVRVFETMPHRNTVSWNTMILGHANMEDGGQALELYALMQKQGVVPDDLTFIGALKACVSILVAGETGSEDELREQKRVCLQQVRRIHSHIRKSRYQSALFVANMLVDVYAKCGSLVEARAVFDQMPRRNVVSWNSLILGYAQMEEGEVALQLYAQMQEQGVAPDARAFVGALKACSTLVTRNQGASGEGEQNADGAAKRSWALEQVRAIHSDVVTSGAESEVQVGNMLVDVYAKCGSLADARTVFERMPYRDVVSWNTMILGYAHMDDGDQALQLYAQMEGEGVAPDDRTYVGALKACGAAARLDQGRQIHAQISSLGHDMSSSSLFVRTALIDMYSKCGSMDGAQQVFDAAAPNEDVVTWSALMTGYAQQGDSAAVLALFQRLEQAGLQADSITFLSVLTACRHAGLVDTGRSVFAAMARDYAVAPTIDHYTCLVDLLGLAGRVHEAAAVVRAMPFRPDAVVLQSLLGSCLKWGLVELGREVFEQARTLGKADASMYVAMYNLYVAARMWEDAELVQAMRVRSQAWKQQGQSWWTDGLGNLHAFVAGDQMHLEWQHVYAKLQQIKYTTVNSDQPNRNLCSIGQ